MYTLWFFFTSCHAGASEVNQLNRVKLMLGVPNVIMDCTHSVQRPSAGDGKTVGDRKFVPAMAKAAKAFGATGYFFEVHPDPDQGKSDAANMLELNKLESLIEELL